MSHWSTIRWMLLGACVVPGISACITPPAVMEGSPRILLLEEFPRGTEIVELAVEEGVVLRGVFVPAGTGAPVVVHFLESGCSVAKGTRKFPSLPVLQDLRDVGLASLAVDYRGVGASQGSRSPDNIRDDARVIWREALRRTGGDESHVVLRGMSIGTLAATGLLADGVRPRAVVLVAPVRGETVARRFAEHAYPQPVGLFACLFMSSVTDVELLETLGSTRVELLVAAPGTEPFLPPDEQRMVRYAVRAAEGRWVAHPDQDHIDLVLEAHRILPEESELYWEIYPDRPPIAERVAGVLKAVSPQVQRRLEPGTEARSRLESIVGRWQLEPMMAAGLALSECPSNPSQRDLVVEWMRSLPPETMALPFDALERLLDLCDPGGPLDPRELRAMRRFVGRAASGSRRAASPEELVERAVVMNLDRRTVFAPLPEKYVDLFEGMQTANLGVGFVSPEAPARLRLETSESFRQSVRLLLKAAGIPDRTTIQDRRPGLEVWVFGSWQPLVLQKGDS